MVAALIILAVASLLGSGVLFSHQRYLTLLAAAGALFEAWWLVLTLAHRVIFPAASGSMVFLLGAILFLLAFVPMRHSFRLPYWSASALPRDAIIVLVLIPTLASAFLIQRSNGFVGADWVAHGFYNGDTATLIALVQRSLGTSGLLQENPFAANGSLEYPTLIHAGLADWLVAAGLARSWLRLLPWLVAGQILITLPLFFLFRDAVKDVPSFRKGYRWGWRGLVVEGAAVGYVLGASWEAYVYPQGHFFTTALFILLLAFLAHAWPLPGREQYLPASFGLLLTTVLLLSNAVTGVAALAVWVVFVLFKRRRWYVLSLAALFLLFVAHAPGQGSFQALPHFSYTAAPGMALLALPIVLLLAAALTQLRQQSLVAAATAALTALALVTFIFSSRGIIVDNASRFLYHALLVGWPLWVDGFVRAARLAQARLTPLRGPLLRSSGIALTASGGILLLLPVGASVMSVHDSLLFQDTHVSSAATQRAMEWISANTEPATVFLAPPEEPWEIPLFTGRTLVRTDYWLSPHDSLLNLVEQAFAGDAASEAAAISAAHYVFLRDNQAEQWRLPPESVVYDAGGIKIYDVGG